MAGGQMFEAQRGTFFSFDPDELVIVGRDKPYADAGEEHQLWDPRAKWDFDPELVESIMAQGYLQPIRVVRDEDGLPLVAWGRQRVIAGREVKRRLKGTQRGALFLVPALVVPKGTSDLEQAAGKLAENALRRADTALDLADKAAAALRLGADTPQARKLLAISLGVPVKRLERLLGLRSAHPDLVRAARDGLPVEQALALAELPRAEQPAAAAKAKAGGYTVQTARETVQTRKAIKTSAKGGDARWPAPSKSTVRRVLDDKEGREILRGESGDRVARWLIGDLAPTQIKGLVALLAVEG